MSDNWMMEHLLGEGECIFFFFFFLKIGLIPSRRDVFQMPVWCQAVIVWVQIPFSVNSGGNIPRLVEPSLS